MFYDHLQGDEIATNSYDLSVYTAHNFEVSFSIEKAPKKEKNKKRTNMIWKWCSQIERHSAAL